MKSIFGYVSVSTKDQNETKQLLVIEVFSMEKNIIVKMQFFKDFERPKHRKLLRHMKKMIPL